MVKAYSAPVRSSCSRYCGVLCAVGLAVTTGLTACGLSDGSSGEFCGLLKDQMPAYTDEPLKALAADSSASAWKAHFDLMRQRTVKLAGTAPDEVRAAVDSLRTTNDTLAELFAAAQYDPAQMDPGAVEQLLQDTGYHDAVASVTRYASRTCGIDTGASGG
jgi:hypothetical protein